MKKVIATCLLSSLILCGCAGSLSGGEEETSASSTNQIPSGDQIALDAAEARAEYYQKLVAELQREILTIKMQHEDQVAEYESRIEELEAERSPLQESTAVDFRYTIKDGKAILIAYVGKKKQVEIPATLGNRPLTKIADRGFENNLNVESIVIPEGVEYIGWFAFSGCISLKSITVPKSVSKIEYGTFENCPSTLGFYCAPDSYAAQYAQSYGYKVVK
jgi:hypothetical protein